MRELKAKLRNGQTVRAKGLLYSGINDVDGNEICEGHILQVREVFEGQETKYITDIKWEDAAFVMKSGEKDYDTFLAAWSGSPERTVPWFELKIIGNIFDNPELLGGTR